jgi:type I restriction enzyme R subunit
VKRLAAKQPDEAIPAALHGKREATVIYNNLPRILAPLTRPDRSGGRGIAEYGDERLRLALEIDRVMREQGAGRMER